MSYLLFGVTAFSLSWLLLDMCCHGEGGAVVAVSQVDDVGDGGQHGSLTAGADDGVPFAHCQQKLPSTCTDTQKNNKCTAPSVRANAMAGDVQIKKLFDTARQDRHVLYIKSTFFVIQEERPTDRSEVSVGLPLCTALSRSGCPWPPSSESSRCREAFHKHAAS